MFNFKPMTQLERDQLTRQFAEMTPYLSFGTFDYYGHDLKVLQYWTPSIDSTDGEVKYFPKTFASEEDVADVLGCTFNRLHQATVRSGKFQHLKRIKIENLKDVSKLYDGYLRVTYQDRTYAPLSRYHDIIMDLAQRRPWLPVAKEIKVKGYKHIS